jgi:hypothetical protein
MELCCYQLTLRQGQGLLDYSWILPGASEITRILICGKGNQHVSQIEGPNPP